MHLVLTTNATPLKTPSDDNSRQHENELSMIRTFLENLTLPLTLSNVDHSQIIKQARHFFLQGRRLWRKDHGGRHQLVVPKPDRLRILHEGHDKLGHKGLYST
jgi:hypothetical protein